MNASNDNNNVIIDFNNWCDNDKDVVVVMAAKWSARNRENLITHSFKSHDDEVENLNLNKLMLVEVLENWYDNTHNSSDEKRQAAFAAIQKKADEILDSIIDLE